MSRVMLQLKCHNLTKNKTLNSESYSFGHCSALYFGRMAVNVGQEIENESIGERKVYHKVGGDGGGAGLKAELVQVHFDSRASRGREP